MPATPVLPQRTTAELTAHLDELRAAPAEVGTVHLVARRPQRFTRELLEEGVLDATDGLVGDNWYSRATSRAIAAGRHLDAQVTVMSARMVALLSDDLEDQAAAGDQLYVDLDISLTNLPTGSRLEFGEPGAGGAVIEVSAKPHNGCAKFTTRYGEEATAFVNSPAGRQLRLRGLNARVVEPGVVRRGDRVRVVRRGGQDDRTGTGAREALAV